MKLAFSLRSHTSCFSTSLSSLQKSFITIHKHSIHTSTKSHHLLSLCHTISHLQAFKSHLIVTGQFPNQEAIVLAFLKHCFHLGFPQLALSTFKNIQRPNLYLQNLVIRCLCDTGLFQEVLLVYKRCKLYGCPSDNYTFPFVIKACSGLSSVRIGREVHCVVFRYGFESNVFVQTSLVDFYAKIGHLEKAHKLFGKMSQPDLVSWSALISGYSLRGLYDEVFGLFQDILEVGLKPNVSILSSVISVSSRSGNFHVGMSLHGLAFKCGYLMDEMLAPALISMYAGGGYLFVARDMFDSLSKDSVTTWNAMISAYTQNQNFEDAFVLFRQMLKDGLLPNMITFVSIISSCESTLCGESLHACVVVKGFANDLPIATVLISMYAKLGNVDSAEFIFYRMPQRNILTWNSMVSAYVHNGCWLASLDTFREMQFGGFDPDLVSVVSILSSCSKLGAMLLGKSAHAFSLRRGMDMNLNVSNAVLAFYCDCHDMNSTFNVFYKMAIKNAVSWNTIISRYVHVGEAKQAIFLLHDMQQEGLDLDLVTVVSVLPCFSEAGDLAPGMALHGYAIKRGFNSHVALANALISMYMNCGDLDTAKLLFENLPHRCVVSWNALITGYRHQGLQNEVMVLFGRMIQENQKPNHVTLLNVLPVCHTHMQGKSIHAYAARTGFLQVTPFVTALMLMYARFESVSSCLLLFQMGDKCNISLWNAIISALVQSKHAEKAFSFFRELLQAEKKPDYVTVLSLTSACIQLNDSGLSNSVMTYVIKQGFEEDVAIVNAFIDLYARSGNIISARTIFNKLPQKDAISWSVMINGYALHGDGEAAIALLSQMRLLGLRPDDITYISLLSACSHSGLVDKARRIFSTMVDDGVIPRIEHYACLVDLLGRTGHLVEAYEILKSLSYKPPADLLESLLGSCLVHNNVELGEEIGRLLLEMEPETSRPYIVLYNLYAAAGKWTDANRVRYEMEKKQVMKTPGLSLLEDTGRSL